jgi:hypothetical protein
MDPAGRSTPDVFSNARTYGQQGTFSMTMVAFQQSTFSVTA